MNSNFTNRVENIRNFPLSEVKEKRLKNLEKMMIHF